MARDISVSRRIARDRGAANFFAFIASLPALAVVVGLIYVGYRVVAGQSEDLASNAPQQEREGAYVDHPPRG
jgi:hypothetical protein